MLGPGQLRGGGGGIEFAIQLSWLRLSAGSLAVAPTVRVGLVLGAPEVQSGAMVQLGGFKITMYRGVDSPPSWSLICDGGGSDQTPRTDGIYHLQVEWEAMVKDWDFHVHANSTVQPRAEQICSREGSEGSPGTVQYLEGGLLCSI